MERLIWMPVALVAILLPVLPVVLTAPLWSPTVRAGRGSPRALAAMAVGLALSLAWALPAARAGGPAYSGAILWTQTAGRLTRAFAHPRQPETALLLSFFSDLRFQARAVVGDAQAEIRAMTDVDRHSACPGVTPDVENRLAGDAGSLFRHQRLKGPWIASRRHTDLNPVIECLMCGDGRNDPFFESGSIDAYDCAKCRGICTPGLGRCNHQVVHNCIFQYGFSMAVVNDTAVRVNYFAIDRIVFCLEFVFR
jgi:hypothetical protein